MNKLDKEKLKFRVGFASFIAGVALMCHHVIAKGFFTWELLGHETLGAVLSIIGYILLAKKKV